jgi:hypothetical protein
MYRDDIQACNAIAFSWLIGPGDNRRFKTMLGGLA